MDSSADSKVELDLVELSQVWDKLRVEPEFVGEKLKDEYELLDQFIPVVGSLQGIQSRDNHW